LHAHILTLRRESDETLALLSAMLYAAGTAQVASGLAYGSTSENRPGTV